MSSFSWASRQRRLQRQRERGGGPHRGGQGPRPVCLQAQVGRHKLFCSYLLGFLYLLSLRLLSGNALFYRGPLRFPLSYELSEVTPMHAGQRFEPGTCRMVDKHANHLAMTNPPLLHMPHP